MAFSFEPLWKLLIEKNMTKEEMRLEIGLSPTTVAKMSKQKNMNTDVIDRICNHFGCSVDQVIKHVPGDQKKTNEKI
ncbi:helix-turn-helix transcriptional regulator [Priestia sp. JV24]|uniref:helix-turn-helix domain-containing protein n=1 Tax=Priestia TaxID=2800373 RepID=UPI0021D64FCE|nr:MULTISPECIES: helix-turn-helix transcriptional regulator [Priestia]MCU7712990.1 helix-turn-helix transcriptional regulator [Priestia megaterium]MCW1049175.1 helix-turn-helix transcriptional regulator [Priestia sp. JV24]